MYRPVLVTAPAATPIILAEAKAQLRVDFPDDDALIGSLISAVTDHLDGWTGILGRCLVEQEWRQDFDCFARCLPLPLGPVTSVLSAKWRDSAAAESTIDQGEYTLLTDAGGRSHVRFNDGFTAPSDLAEKAAVSVTYKAGYPTVNGVSTVPAAIKAAILLHVAHLYQNREAVAETSLAELPMGVDALLAPYRAMRI
ncbi:hypothetical protein FJW07_14100 [Mesorhizobium sp. B3-1-9]|uniref:head-tail connector protein n=1 Tax=Mesorhizobium sp. B3-1-9 TaxID=2589892 RepID=UPI0011293981|nr:head-tail connector protein [Mesorhizobium sp. B3-1-9]TPI39307.1 hypothetical protein FJW07_14100 [Mesorhizobium sp. B3-1-9]